MLVLSQADVRALLSVRECNDAVSDAFARNGRGETATLPIIRHQPVDATGWYELKSAYIAGKRSFGLKAISIFPENPSRHGLPNIQATIFLWESETGRLVAMMDGTHITGIRTGAGAAVAARHLAQGRADRVAVIGTGVQGRSCLTALAAELPIGEVVAWSPTPERRERYATEMAQGLGLRVNAVATAQAAVTGADVVLCCTWSRAPLVMRDWVKAGAYIAAIGAGTPGMQELDPRILLDAKVVVDDLVQCSHAGEISNPVKQGLYDPKRVHGTIGEVVAGLIAGREHQDEITVFDSTGLGIQDVAVAELVYEKASRTRQ